MKVTKEGVLLEPSDNEFENRAVLNPACVQQGDEIHMFYRAVTGHNHSTIGYCRLDGPTKVVERQHKPVIAPEYDYEKHGLEDPRIVKFEDSYYLFYVAYDGKNARIAYATSEDLKSWQKHGIISPNCTYDQAEDYFRKNKSQLKERYFWFESYHKDVVGPDVLLWEKDTFMLPEKINDKYALIHRILPEMQIVYFDNFENLKDEDFWCQYLKKLGEYVVLEPYYGYESRNIGGGAPFLKTAEGWLNIYHAVQDMNRGRIYRASAALHDLEDPTKVLGRLAKPLLSPTEDYELKGDVDDVVFPSSLSLFGDKLYIYYGAADRRIAVASVSLSELITELLSPDSASSKWGVY
ncbi:pesticidal protein Cry7Aa [Patescibacteria group bacterium]